MNAILRNKDYPIEMLVLSHSSRSTFRSCARKLEFRQFYGTVPREDQEESFAGAVGNAIHRGIETWLMTHDEKKAAMSLMLAYPHKMEFLKPEYNKRSLEACYFTLMKIISSPVLQPYDIAKIKVGDETRFCVEVPFALEIVGSPMPIPVFYVGFIDCALYKATFDKYLVVDAKSTRMTFKDNDPSPRYQFDEQTIPYGIVLEHALGKTIEEIDVSYLHCYIDLIEPKVQLIDLTKTQQDVEDWIRGLSDDIARIAKYYGQGWFPRATDGHSCMGWNTKCFYMDWCYYRKPETLRQAIPGEVRTELFSTGEKPWITAKLEWVG